MALAALVALMCAIIMCGCRTPVRYLPVETVRTEWRERDVSVNDIREHRAMESVSESVAEKMTVTVNDRGDTLRTDRERERIRDRTLEQENRRLVAVMDSIRAERADTIRVPYPVERELSPWEKTKMDFGGMAIGAIAAAVCVAAVWLIIKFRK